MLVTKDLYSVKKNEKDTLNINKMTTIKYRLQTYTRCTDFIHITICKQMHSFCTVAANGTKRAERERD